jgi:23S rRNA pseudouridine1911/1915/1917 synthase
LDNFRENAKVLLEEELRMPLYITHRLDIPTEGLLIIAKTPDAQKQLNRAFSLGRVEKIYRSINSLQVESGTYTHFMNPESRVPRVVQTDEVPGWWRCQMDLLRSAPWRDGFWHEIQLQTGKTHQIRAQMSFLGSPVCGDKTYGAAGEALSEGIALECYRLSFQYREKTFTLTRPRSIVEG